MKVYVATGKVFYLDTHVLGVFTVMPRRQTLVDLLCQAAEVTDPLDEAEWEDIPESNGRITFVPKDRSHGGTYIEVDSHELKGNMPIFSIGEVADAVYKTGIEATVGTRKGELYIDGIEE